MAMRKANEISFNRMICIELCLKTFDPAVLKYNFPFCRFIVNFSIDWQSKCLIRFTDTVNVYYGHLFLRCDIPLKWIENTKRKKKKREKKIKKIPSTNQNFKQPREERRHNHTHTPHIHRERKKEKATNGFVMHTNGCKWVFQVWCVCMENHI